MTQPFDLVPHVPKPTSPGIASLWVPRTRTSLGRRFGASWPAPGRIGLCVPKERRSSVLSAGASIDEFGRVSIPRDWVVRNEWQPHAPLVARREYVPLLAEMIPFSSFGASLKNLLVDEDWRRIRRTAYQAAGSVCRSCGESDGPVECHEVWRFDDVQDENGWSRQTLTELLCLCHECHEMFHPGLANVNGRSDAVIARTMKVNGWSSREHARAADYLNRLHAGRSRLRWALDLTLVADAGPLAISTRWTAGDDGVLSMPEARARTMVVGIDVTLAGSAIRSPGRGAGTASTHPIALGTRGSLSP